MKGKRCAKSSGGRIALVIVLLVVVAAAGGIAWWLLGSGGPAPAAESTDPVTSAQPTPSPTPAPTPTPTPEPTPTPTPTVEERTAALAAEMTAEMSQYEKICQLIIVSPEDLTGVSTATQAGAATKAGLERYPICGILYRKPNMLSQSQLKQMLDNSQSYSKIPLILTCDEEGGRVTRLMSTVGTTCVGPMLDYEDQGPETAYDNAYTIGSDLASCGFNTDLAPVADVWTNPENTVIGDRAYSTDFNTAAELVAAAVEGFHDGGVGAVLKHFPGHGGTSTDSHDGATYLYRTLDQLRQGELIPFQAGIEAGADAVMMGHLIVPDLDDQPAPLSYEIVTGLLREEMGFNGVVMTDAMEMSALTKYYTGGQAAVMAIQAGVDILLCPGDLDSTIAALEAAVEDGSISEERLDESVQRILTFKINRGLIPLE